jgi:hypothetical protein
MFSSCVPEGLSDAFDRTLLSYSDCMDHSDRQREPLTVDEAIRRILIRCGAFGIARLGRAFLLPDDRD